MGRRVNVSQLEALGAALESPDDEWAGASAVEILALETVYPVRLDRGGELSDGDAQIIAEAIENLRKIIGSRRTKGTVVATIESGTSP